MHKSRTRIVCGVAALMLASCGGGGDRAPQTWRAPTRAPVTRPPAVGLPAAPYFAEAAAIDLFAVRSAELAMQRSSNARIREFASMMMTAHRGAAAQLSLAGRRLNLLPSARLTPKYQAMFDQLQSTADFDVSYRRLQLVVHQEALTLHSRYASRGGSPTLRPVASAMVPIVERHLRLLRYL